MSQTQPQEPKNRIGSYIIYVIFLFLVSEVLATLLTWLLPILTNIRLPGVLGFILFCIVGYFSGRIGLMQEKEVKTRGDKIMVWSCLILAVIVSGVILAMSGLYPKYMLIK